MPSPAPPRWGRAAEGHPAGSAGAGLAVGLLRGAVACVPSCGGKGGKGRGGWATGSRVWRAARASGSAGRGIPRGHSPRSAVSGPVQPVGPSVAPHCCEPRPRSHQPADPLRPTPSPAPSRGRCRAHRYVHRDGASPWIRVPGPRPPVSGCPPAWRYPPLLSFRARPRPAPPCGRPHATLLPPRPCYYISLGPGRCCGLALLGLGRPPHRPARALGSHVRGAPVCRPAWGLPHRPSWSWAGPARVSTGPLIVPPLGLGQLLARPGAACTLRPVRSVPSLSSRPPARARSRPSSLRLPWGVACSRESPPAVRVRPVSELCRCPVAGPGP